MLRKSKTTYSVSSGIVQLKCSILEFSVRLSNWMLQILIIYDLHLCFLVYLLAAWAILQLSDGCCHYRWQGFKFRPMLGTYGFQQWGCFFVSTPTTRGDLVLYGLIQKTGTHIPLWDSNWGMLGSPDLCSNHRTCGQPLVCDITYIISNWKYTCRCV
jgi:hypothetical protein